MIMIRLNDWLMMKMRMIDCLNIIIMKTGKFNLKTQNMKFAEWLPSLPLSGLLNIRGGASVSWPA